MTHEKGSKIAADFSFLGLAREAAQEPEPSAHEHIRRIFEEQRNSIYRYLRALGASAGDAEELTQESFLRLFHFLNKGNRVQNPRAWLLRVAHNLLRDEGRQRCGISEASLGPTDLSEQIADPAPTPEARLLDVQRDERIEAAMNQLTTLQRSALHLRCEGLQYHEIAEILNVSISTVAVAVRRAVSRLARSSDE